MHRLSQLNEISHDRSLFEEENFVARVEAIDFIECEIIAPLDYDLMNIGGKDEIESFKKQAQDVKTALVAVDHIMFKKLTERIKSGVYAGRAFVDIVRQYVNFDLTGKGQLHEPGYDDLDVFINGLLHPEPLPTQTTELEPEMIYYQKTPARLIFQLIEEVNFKDTDVFVDIGSGLGQAAMLVNLLTGIKATGIEYEPAFFEYAANCAVALNLHNVSFINADARQVNHSEGTIFFMFSPFKGKILQRVLLVLCAESRKRNIKIVTYGPCTPEVAAMNCFSNSNPGNDIYKLTIFDSL